MPGESDERSTSDEAQGPTLTDAHHDWVSATFGADPRASEASPSGEGSEMSAVAALPLPAPGFVEEVEDAVVSGVRSILPVAPEVAEAGGTPGLIAGAVANAGALAVGGVLVAGVVVGATIGAGIGYLIEHGEELDQQTDPDEKKPDGGLPAGSGPDGLPGQPPDAGPPVSGSDDEPDRHDEEAYADSVVSQYNPADKKEGDCDPIIEAIKGMIKCVRERYDALAEHAGGDAGHRQRYQQSQRRLKRLIEMAKSKECPIDTSEAEEWSSYPLP